MAYARWTEAEKEIIRTKGPELSCFALEELLPGRTYAQIGMKRKRMGIKAPRYNHEADDHYFSQDTLENCYWAGFLAADGCINAPKIGKGQKELQFVLKASDGHMVDSFALAIKFSGEPRSQDYSGYPARVLKFRNDPLCLDLQNRYNITARKSLTYKPPSRLKGDFAKAFKCGYMDGDGWIGLNGVNLFTGACGTPAMLQWLLPDSLHGHIKPSSRSKEHRFNITGHKAAKFLRSIKPVGLRIPELARKWDNLRAFEN